MLEQNIVFFDWSLQFLKIYLSMIPFVMKQNAKDLINVDAGIPKLDVFLLFFQQRQRLCCGQPKQKVTRQQVIPSLALVKNDQQNGKW